MDARAEEPDLPTNADHATATIVRPSRRHAPRSTPRVADAALVLVLALVVLASCTTSISGGSTGGTTVTGSVPAAGRNTTVKFLTVGSPEELDAYREAIKAFEASQPEIKVELLEAADNKDLLTRLSTSFGAGNPPDLFLINYRSFGQYAAKGAIDPIGPRVASSTAFEESDFYAEALDGFRFDGQLTCLPQNASSLVVYFNKALFEAAGVEVPKAGWSWADMVAKAKQLTKDTDGDGKVDQFGLGIDAELIRVAPFVWSNGGEVVDDTAKPTKLALGTPAAAEVLEDFLDLYRVDEVIPGEQEIESEDIDARFQSGTMAMLFDSRRSTPGFRAVPSLDFDVAPLPVYEKPVSILHADAYCLSAASANKEAAWKFIEFAVGPKGAPIVAATGRTVPSLKSVATSTVFLDPEAKPAHAQVWLDNISSLRSVPNIATWPEIESATSKILEDALYEGGNASEVAEEMAKATQDMFDRANK
jgi:multiple sugar transport system substrate-binding protein